MLPPIIISLGVCNPYSNQNSFDYLQIHQAIYQTD